VRDSWSSPLPTGLGYSILSALDGLRITNPQRRQRPPVSSRVPNGPSEIYEVITETLPDVIRNG